MTSVRTRLRNPPFGTETSERNLMTAAADQIDELYAALDAACSHLEDAERESYWTCGDPYSDEGPIKEFRALLAKIGGAA